MGIFGRNKTKNERKAGAVYVEPNGEQKLVPVPRQKTVAAIAAAVSAAIAVIFESSDLGSTIGKIIVTLFGG